MGRLFWVGNGLGPLSGGLRPLFSGLGPLCFVDSGPKFISLSQQGLTSEKFQISPLGPLSGQLHPLLMHVYRLEDDSFSFFCFMRKDLEV